MPIFWTHYDKRRIKAKVTWHNLVLQDSPPTPTNQYVKVKVLPREFSGSPAIIFIYGNNVVHVIWSQNFFAFRMSSKEVADNYKKYFNYLWDNVAK